MGIGVRQPVEVLCAHLWHICKFIHKYIYVCVHTHTSLPPIHALVLQLAFEVRALAQCWPCFFSPPF